MKHKVNIRLIFVVVMTSNVFVLAGYAEKPEKVNNAQPALLAQQTANDEPNDRYYSIHEIEEKWGIKVESARLSAGDYMIDFRFRVLDVEKAQPILDRKINPYLIDQTTGAKFSVPNPPKVGQMRSSGNIKPGNVCFIMFANPAKYVKSGNKVTIVVGDFRVKDIVVQ